MVKTPGDLAIVSAIGSDREASIHDALGPKQSECGLSFGYYAI